MSLANNAAEQNNEAQQSDPEKITSTSSKPNSNENSLPLTLPNDGPEDLLSASSNPVLRALLESLIALESESEEDLPTLSSPAIDEENVEIVPLALDQNPESGIAGFWIKASDADREDRDVGPLPIAADADAGDERMCHICHQTQPCSSFPQRTTTSNCDHPANVCPPCLANFLAQQMDQILWDQVERSICPEC